MYSDADIIETDNSFELHCNFSDIHRDSVETKIYLLNKKTLAIYDSITGFDSIIRPNNVLNINDSIYFTFGLYKLSYDGVRYPCEQKIKIVNRNTKEIKSIDFVMDMQSSVLDMNYYPEFSSKFDYIHTDSMYMVVFSPDVIVSGVEVGQENSLSNKIKIINFNIQGGLNYEYDFDFDSTKWKQINGVKATNDGGLIISYVDFEYEDCWIIKFMPNGFVGLTNIETNEKASIKVYPNPSKDIINVDIEADRFSSSEIELFDIQGRLVKKSKLNAQIGNRIDVSTFNPGAYTYRVVINGKGISRKVIIGE
ncbi:MAG: T9SS type A sorting domain-containing protein [Bacteroidales bacterium]